MNLAILNTQQQEQKTIEEMKKYTDLFREEKSLDQTAVIELKNTDRDGYFIHREDDRYVVEYGCLPDMCRALLLLSGMEHQVKQEIGEKCIGTLHGRYLFCGRGTIFRIYAWQNDS